MDDGVVDGGVMGAGYVDYAELKGMLRALGDIQRLNMIRVLATTSEMTVTDLAQTLLLSQPLVSWHLGALRRHGLVRKHRQGRQVYCSLNVERYRRCLRLLGSVIGEAVAPSASNSTSASSLPDPAAEPGDISARAAPTHSVLPRRAAMRRRVPAPRPAPR